MTIFGLSIACKQVLNEPKIYETINIKDASFKYSEP